jgi:pyruvate dehydrogenase E1 component beta subunit
MFESARKTGRVLVCDIGWRTGGIGAEIAARISEACWNELKAPVRRVALPDLPAAAARTLEKVYYPDEKKIAEEVRELMQSGRGKTR